MKKICLIFLLSSIVWANGCRKDLCYDHDLHGLSTRTHLSFDWEQEWERDYGMSWQENWSEKHGMDYDELRPEAATGIATFVYHEDGSRSERHLTADGGEIPMTVGEKSILLHNNDTRYIVFNDLTSSVTASATTRTRTRLTYSETHTDETTVNAPDMLYGAWIDSYTAVPAAEPDSLSVTLRPLVYTYLIRYEFEEGLEHVTLARGAISGMAQSVYLQDGHTSEESATVLFDCDIKNYGAEIQLTSFGVPNFPGDHYVRQSTAQRQGLNLEVMLKNGKIKTFEFDVTDQLISQPRGGVITVSGLTVTDEEAGGDTGFNVNVDDWGEYEDIELPLN
ncbi:MAG TPA: DUF5119 domain-containing protein [Candidatus Gallibacteroides avistercoris]|uniref:DUF5119 domain-containing protein n=1 Tax=Candidatus Gallibacteroides avistercoris TaxID=2840833 RepID=A0A9D1M962_9BACT|nr:DUF5119 domain-containing protein [Candidatus Gallibacteroides avistercoris]